MVVVLGFRYGVKRYTGFDICCQALAIIGIILWRLTHDPIFAIFLVITADLVGSLPTIRHAWAHPSEETWQTFAIDSFAAGLSLFSLIKLNYVTAGYQAYIVAGNLLIAVIILHKRRANKRIIEIADVN